MNSRRAFFPPDVFQIYYTRRKACGVKACLTETAHVCDFLNITLDVLNCKRIRNILKVTDGVKSKNNTLCTNKFDLNLNFDLK